jgi:hypothetical protein
MLEAVKPVLLEKVDNIWSQFLTRVFAHLLNHVTVLSHSPSSILLNYYTVSTSMIIVRVAYILNR